MKDKVIVGSTVYAEPHDIDDLWETIYIRVLVHVIEGYNRTTVRLQVESVIRQVAHLQQRGLRLAGDDRQDLPGRSGSPGHGVGRVDVARHGTSRPPLEDQDMAPITGNANPSPGIRQGHRSRSVVDSDGSIPLRC